MSPSLCLSLSPTVCLSLSLLQMAHLVPVKTHSSSMSGSQSLQDQTGSALSEGVSAGSPRPEMPRQNSDPTSDTPGPPMRIAGREERDRERERDRDRDRTAWLREEDIPPKVRESQTWRKTSTNDAVCCSEFCVHCWILLIFWSHKWLICTVLTFVRQLNWCWNQSATIGSFARFNQLLQNLEKHKLLTLKRGNVKAHCETCRWQYETCWHCWPGQV